MEFDSLSRCNVLYTTWSSDFVEAMQSVMGNYYDAWVLTIAHESGHIILNQMCFNCGLNSVNNE